MVEKNEEEELSLEVGAAEALMQISAGRSCRALLPAPPRMWGQRRPRSRQITLAGILRVKSEQADAGAGTGAGAGAGDSPKSTLLWNCATSPSDDGVEVCEARSEKRKAEGAAPATAEKETMTCTTIPSTMPSTSTSLCRRVKKKKTLDELREEERALVSANMGLKEDIEKMQRCFAELLKTNKGLKLKLQTREAEEKRKKVESLSDVVDAKPKKGFILPDLNEPFDLEMVS